MCSVGGQFQLLAEAAVGIGEATKEGQQLVLQLGGGILTGSTGVWILVVDLEIHTAHTAGRIVYRHLYLINSTEVECVGDGLWLHFY